jgi:pyruvate ferredoxin oxidoreductase alpha subunit
VVVNESYPVIVKAWKEWAELTGREYKPVETYKADDAEFCFVTMGSLSENAMMAVDALREKGQKVGLIKIRLWRPFPFDDFFAAVKGKKGLAVMDRAMSFGGPGGPVAIELRSALYDKPGSPRIVNFIAGLAGRDVTSADFVAIMDQAREKIEKNDTSGYVFYGVRE